MRDFLGKDIAVAREVAARLGADGGDVADAAAGLSAGLEQLAREAATAGIAARYGAAVWGHRIGLFRAAAGCHTSYGPSGVAGAGMTTVCRRV